MWVGFEKRGFERRGGREGRLRLTSVPEHGLGFENS